MPLRTTPTDRPAGGGRSTGREYARLVVSGALFALPLAVLVLIAILGLGRTGEIATLNIPAFVRTQQASPSEMIYGPAYSDCTQQLKLESTIARRSELLVMGTSRSLQVRDSFFRRSFYNAGNGTARARDLQVFLAHVPEAAEPKVILLLLDQFFLNAATDAAVAKDYRPIEESLTACQPELEFVLANWSRIYRDLVARKVSVGNILNPPHAEGVGIRAQVTGSGLRRDGSHRFEGPDSFDDVRKRMLLGVRRYEFGDDVSPAMVGEVASFLEAAARRNIRVVGVLPPYPPTIRDEMTALGRWRYAERVGAILGPKFREHGHALYDYSDVRELGLTDREFFDGFHGSERAWATILVDLAKRDTTMREVVDVARIEAMLRASTDPFSIAPP